MTYEPKPVETVGIKLPSDIEQLTEELAKNAHEVWARQRIKDGWTHGPTRDDHAKQHPCLIPYEQLENSEKQYDRNAALETLKVILARGYHIVPPLDVLASGSLETTAQVRQRCEDFLARMQAVVNQPEELAVLMRVWSERNADDPAWRCSSDLYRHLGRRFLKVGAAPQAKEVARSALEWTIPGTNNAEVAPWGDDVDLRQILGLALARTGNTDEAQTVLLKLREQGRGDEETLGMLARTYKDKAFQVQQCSPLQCSPLSPRAEPSDSSPLSSRADEYDSHIDERRKLLAESLRIYREAYERSQGFWTGINVATLERLLDHSEESAIIARRVWDDCQRDLLAQREKGKQESDLYWHLATLGEAAFNLGDLAAAEQHYRAAYAAAPREFGNLNSTRRHLRWLLAHGIQEGSLKPEADRWLDEWLPIPKVVVFAGHMIDHPQRVANGRAERFPPRLAESVKQTLKHWLSENHALIGYSSAACGADLLFQQAIQELGGESRIVLPFDADDFRKQSVDFAGPEWSPLFDTVQQRATQIVTASPQRMETGGISYEYANLVLHGLASVRAAELEAEPIGLVVWDRQSGDGPGGTASIVRRWRDLGMPVDCIDLSRESGFEPRPSGSGPQPLPVTLPDGRGSKHSPLLSVIRNPTPPEVICEGADGEVSKTRIMAMLFGDAVNFGKLTEEQVPRFVEHFFGPIADIVRQYGSRNVTRNTWGDGLYLVFTTVQDAGLCALQICEFVKQHVEQLKWPALGLPEKLGVRLALHAGPVFSCIDPITGQLNYTGTHVSRAARLEPKTPAGEVYASQAFAALCSENKVTGFVCEYVKQLEWAKTYGTFPTFVLRHRPPSSKREF